MISKNIGIVEDQGIFRELLRDRLVEMGEEVLWAVGSLSEARQKLTEEEPGLLLLDMDLPDGEGYELMEWWLNRNHRGRILVLTGWVESYPVLKLKRSGAMGVLDKLDATGTQLLDALSTVKRNRLYYSERVEGQFQELVNEPSAYYKRLTAREEEIVKYLGCGMSNHETGTALGISELTIQGHRRNILHKLGLGTTAELISWAIREGFVKPRQLAMRGESPSKGTLAGRVQL